MMNKKGPRMKPCRTPTLMFLALDFCPFKTTFIFIDLLRQAARGPEIRTQIFDQPKALLMSSQTTITSTRLLSELAMWHITYSAFQAVSYCVNLISVSLVIIIHRHKCCDLAGSFGSQEYCEIQAKKGIHFFCFLLFWESFKRCNFGTTGPIQVGLSAKLFLMGICHMFDFHLIPLDRIT